MKTIKFISRLKQELAGIRPGKIGFVPTMGYLHEGHLGLIRESIAKNDYTVVSIYVNPAQFGPDEDLDGYPRDFPRDKKVLEEIKVDYLFYPDNEEMYPPVYQTMVQIKNLAKVLCGISRPGHFRGVCTIVLKLFNIINPHTAYFGAKDAQQAIILKRMVTDLNVGVNIRVLPVARDKDGLALSSRNRYLSLEQRREVHLFPRTLQKIKERILGGERDSGVIIENFLQEFKDHDLIEVEYIKIVSLNNLEEIKAIDLNNTLIAAAIRIGHVRLIDNFILGEI